MENENPTPEQQQPSVQQAPEGYIEQARYNGLVRKVEQLTIENRQLKTDLETRTSETEQLRTQIGTKDVEKDIAVREREKALGETTERVSQLEKELDALKAFKVKYDAVMELNDPRLFKIIDKLPAMTDVEAMKTVLKDFSSFASEAVAERERQLTAGVVQNVGAGARTSVAPSSDKEWMAHIESLPLGSPERDKAYDEYYEYLSSQHKK